MSVCGFMCKEKKKKKENTILSYVLNMLNKKAPILKRNQKTMHLYSPSCSRV